MGKQGDASPGVGGYAHAINCVKLIYKQKDFEAGTDTPGQTIEREFNSDIRNSEVAPLFVFLDEFIHIYKTMTYYYLSSVFDDPTKMAITGARMSELALNHLASIRMLSSRGLDVAARLHLRSLYETNILFLRLQIDPDARTEFQDCGSPASANTFWHKYVSKDKSELFIDNYVKTHGGFFIGRSDEFKKMRKGIGPSAHPSFLSSYFALLDRWRGPEQDSLILHGAGNATPFTMSSAIHMAIIPFAIVPLPTEDFQTLELFDPKKKHPANSAASDWKQYIALKRSVMFGLWLMAQKFIEEISNNDTALTERTNVHHHKTH